MATLDDIDLTITDDLLREIHEAWEARTLRLKHPYVFDLIKVLATSAKSPRMSVIDRLHANRKNAGLPIPEKFDSVVQAQCNYYCRDSDVFKKRGAPPSDALFSWPNGKGAGVWALIRENAGPWVKANREALPHRILR
jgi:hypothetical protein